MKSTYFAQYCNIAKVSIHFHLFQRDHWLVAELRCKIGPWFKYLNVSNLWSAKYMVSMPWSDFFRRTMYKGPMDRTLRMVVKSLCFSRFEVSWFLTNLKAGEIDLLIDGFVDWLVVLIFIGAHIQVPSIFYKMFLWLLSIRTAKQPVPAFFLIHRLSLGSKDTKM